ncbi:hypothetical protein KAJ27_19490 [bacterium]|nr:hypothetical protein [bacterium]
MKKNLKAARNIIIGIVIMVLITAVPILYFMQDQLLFKRQKISKKILLQVDKQYPDSNYVFKMKNGIKLHGRYIKPENKEKFPLVLYFGGNKGKISKFLFHYKYLKGYALATFNYRGYGLSEGTPTEKNLFDDSISIYDHFASKPEIMKDKIVIFGRSLGTGVAVYLATKRKAWKIILISPYDSICAVAQDKYPWAPVKMLLRNPFYSIKRAPGIKTDLLCFYCTVDKVVPRHNTKKLLKNWGGKVTEFEISDQNHHTIYNDRNLWNNVVKFLNNHHIIGKKIGEK